MFLTQKSLNRRTLLRGLGAAVALPADPNTGVKLFESREIERYLDRAIRLTVGAQFETEARFMLAETYDQVGKKDEAKRERQKLVATGIDDDFTKRAAEKLK